MDEATGRMASSAGEEGAGEESVRAKGDLVDGVVFCRLLELALIAGPSSVIEVLIEATSDEAPDVEGSEGFDSALAEHGSCVSRAFLPARRVRFNGGSPSSGRLK